MDSGNGTSMLAQLTREDLKKLETKVDLMANDVTALKSYGRAIILGVTLFVPALTAISIYFMG